MSSTTSGPLPLGPRRDGGSILSMRALTIAVTGVQFNDAAAGKAAGALSLNVSSLGGFTFSTAANIGQDGTGRLPYSV